MLSTNMSLCTFGIYLHWVHPTVASYTRDSSSAADREGGGQQVQFALGPQCKQALKQCSTHSNTHPSLASLRVLFHCIVNFKSACFHASRLCFSNTNFNAHMLHVYCAVH